MSKAILSLFGKISFELLCMDLIFIQLKLKLLSIYLPPISTKSKTVVSNMIDLIKYNNQNKKSFYVLCDFNQPHVDWKP